MEEWHTGHPGIVRKKEMTRSYLWWPNIDQEIEQASAAVNNGYGRVILGIEFTLITLRTKMGISSFSITHLLASLRSTSWAKHVSQEPHKGLQR